MKRFSFLLFYSLIVLLNFKIKAQWTEMTVPGLPISANSTLIFSPVDADICWGVQHLEEGIINPKFVLTTNGGTTWSVANVQIPTGLGVQSIYALNAQTAWIAVDDPNNGTNSGIYKTTNGGVNWVKQGSSFSGGGHPMSIYFFDSGNGICVGNVRNNEFEIYTTPDGGGNWTQVSGANIPAPASQDITFSSISAAYGNSFWFGTCARDLYRTTNRGVSWEVTRDAFAEPPDYCGVDIAFKDPLNGIAATYFGDLSNRVYKTNDGGVTWTNLPNPPSNMPSFFFLSHVSGDMYIVNSHDNVGAPQPTTPGSAFTKDGGQTWHKIDDLMHGPAWSRNGFSWSGGINDIVYKIPDVALPVELTSFKAQAQDSKVILNWVTATEINNLGFEIQRKVVGNDFATVGFKEGEGTTVNQKEYSYVDKNLADGKYCYRLKQVDFNGTYEYSNIIEVDVRSLDNFTLEQNYPNPFNPTTTIGYVLQEKGGTKLTLMNAIGEEVATLVNEEQGKGYHKVDFNASNLSSGIYFYTLRVGNFTQTKKLILMK